VLLFTPAAGARPVVNAPGGIRDLSVGQKMPSACGFR
jgi:hypothetical protein